MNQRILSVVLLAAGAFVFLLNGLDYSGVEMAWGFFLDTCGFIVYAGVLGHASE